MHAETRPHGHIHQTGLQRHIHSNIYPVTMKSLLIAQLNKKIPFCSAETCSVSFMNESVDGYSCDKYIHVHECHFKDKGLRISFIKRDRPHF